MLISIYVVIIFSEFIFCNLFRTTPNLKYLLMNMRQIKRPFKKPIGRTRASKLTWFAKVAVEILWMAM